MTAETDPSRKPLTATPSAAQWAAQILLFGAFALMIGVFAHWPVYQVLAPDRAVVKVSFTHHGKPVGDCRAPTPEEIAKLPPNMRPRTICPRERSPVVIEVDVDGKTIYRHTAQPSGLSHDGASAVYQRIELAAGAHEFSVRMNDDIRRTDFTYQRTASLTLAPAQILVIDFDAAAGGITLK